MKDFKKSITDLENTNPKGRYDMVKTFFKIMCYGVVTILSLMGVGFLIFLYTLLQAEYPVVNVVVGIFCIVFVAGYMVVSWKEQFGGYDSSIP